MTGTSELSRRDGRRKEKAEKQNQLVLHRQTLYTFLYMLTQWTSSNTVIFFALFGIKTHTDVQYKKIFLFVKEQCFSSVSVNHLMLQRQGYIIYIYNRIKKKNSSCVHVVKKQIHQLGSVLVVKYL